MFKNAFCWKFGYVPRLGMDAAASERVIVTRISAEEFEMEAPGWFKLEEPQSGTPRSKAR